MAFENRTARQTTSVARNLRHRESQANNGRLQLDGATEFEYEDRGAEDYRNNRRNRRERNRLYKRNPYAE